MRSLEKQVAVVTGATSGVGRALSVSLASEGADICLVGRRIDEIKLVAEKVRGYDVQPFIYAVDLTVDLEVNELAARLERDCLSLDILVHSAGVIAPGKVGELSIDELDRQLQTNFRAPFLLTQKLLPRLKSRKGQIVFLNSSQGLNATANVGAYAATKHALKAFADSLRSEVNEEGVRVLSVFLGRTATPLQMAIYKLEGKPYYPERLLQPEDVARVVINALTLPRTAEVTDINIRPLLKS